MGVGLGLLQRQAARSANSNSGPYPPCVHSPFSLAPSAPAGPPLTWPTALTPLSVRAARIQCTCQQEGGAGPQGTTVTDPQRHLPPHPCTTPPKSPPKFPFNTRQNRETQQHQQRRWRRRWRRRRRQRRRRQAPTLMNPLSSAFASEMPPAACSARNSSSSIVLAPGLRCMPWYPCPT